MQSVERCCRAGAVVASLTCCLITGAAIPAVAMRDRLGPSAEEVARARSKAVERSKQLDEATALLAEARATLGQLSGRVRKLIEVSDGEWAKAARAEELLRKVGGRLGIAETATATVEKTAVEPVAEPVTGTETAMEPARVRKAVAPPTWDDSGTAVLPTSGDGGAAMIPLQKGGGAVTIPASGAALPISPAETAAHETAGIRETAGTLGTANALQTEAEAAYAEQWAAAERAAEARRAAEEAVAGQVAEVRRLEEEKARLDRQAKTEADVARRLAGKREAVLKWSGVARERVRRGNLRSAAVARKRARFVAARAVTGPSWPLNTTWQAARGDVAADWALTQLDKPYVWAATGPRGYDCSGLTMQAWARAGVTIEHWTGTQWTSGQHVQISRLRRGDLLFFGRITRNPGDISHVGIYIGRGLMVHAPQTGDVVRVAPIWRRDLVGATRPA